MHEKALMEDLVREIAAVATAEGALRVSHVRGRVGVLSHFTPEHFREHFEQAANGTIAHGAALEVATGTDPTERGAQGVLLQSLDLD